MVPDASGPGFEPPEHVARHVTAVQEFMEQHVLPAEPELEVGFTKQQIAAGFITAKVVLANTFLCFIF